MCTTSTLPTFVNKYNMSTTVNTVYIQGEINKFKFKLAQIEINGMYLSLPHSLPVITGVCIYIHLLESFDIVLAHMLYILLVFISEIALGRD